MYVNKYFKKLLGQNPIGKKCYEVFQKFKYPCDFCTNKKILKNKGKPYDWEYHNPVLNKDYLITDRIIKWHDGRNVRFEFAIDITELKKTKEQIKNQARLIDQVSDAIISMDLDFKILSWNAAAENIYGWTEKEVIGKHIVDLVKPVYKNTTEKDVLKKFYKTGHWSIEMIEKNKKGESLFIQSSGSYIKDSNNKPIGIVAVNRDIYEQKKLQKKVEKSEELFRRAIEEAPIPVIMHAEDGKVLQISKTWTDLTGYKLNDIPTFDEWTSSAVYGEGADKVRDYLKNLFKSSSSSKVEFSIRTKTGRIRYWIFSASAPGMLLDGRRFVVGMALDVTERKLAENKLRISEERFRLSQKAAEIGSWDWDVVTGNLVWSDQIEPMFGFKKGKFGKTYEAFLNCVHPDDRQYVINSVNACVEKNKEYDIEHRIIWPDKSVHWVRETGDVIRDNNGKALRMLGIVHDVTDRKKKEENIKKLNKNLLSNTAELMAINKELEAFSYSVSHDLRAPLRSINGFSQALIEDHTDKLDAEGKDYLNRIRIATQHMGNIIDDLLKLSRITRHPLEHEKVSLSLLSQSIISDLQKKESDRKVKVSIENDLTVMGDKQLLHMVLGNLIGNAWKFTSKKTNAKIEIGKIRKDGKDIFFVRDNGAGFDMKYADKLFVPFQRLHSDEEFEGTGIGLGIVNRIIHRHGGKIWAEGKEDEGATFYFSIRGEIKNK